MTDISQLSDLTKTTWELTLREILEYSISKYPDKLFIDFVNLQITYKEFGRLVAKTAGMFRRLGIEKGDRVCLFLPNCPEFLYCWFGLAMIGAISVPINTAYKKDETAVILNDATPGILIAHSSLIDVAKEAVKLSPSVKKKLVVEVTNNEKDHSLIEGWNRFSELLTKAEEFSDLVDVLPSNVCMLVYTSGTTGIPKGVTITHQMYVAAGQGFAYWTQANEKDRFFTCLPYFHANPQYYSTMGAIVAGATLIVRERFSASKFWQQVRESNATIVNFIGMMLPVLAKQPTSPKDRDHQVRLLYGSPSFSSHFLDSMEERFNVKIIVGFGMTETCYGTIEVIGEVRREGSSGRPRQHPNTKFINDVKIVNENGQILPANTTGEIVITNPATTSGYWENETQTKLTLRKGYLHTGDLGSMDEEGYLYFVDRKKDIIRRRGENISSQEVENVMKQHPKVLDCAMIAVPSDVGEDDIKAYIALRPRSKVDPEELIYWCAERLAYFKVPRYIVIRASLPKTPSLRVRKDLLRLEKHEDCFDLEKSGIKLK